MQDKEGGSSPDHFLIDFLKNSNQIKKKKEGGTPQTMSLFLFVFTTPAYYSLACKKTKQNNKKQIFLDKNKKWKPLNIKKNQ